MKKFLELFAKFHVALFIFGFILVLLSVTTGLELPIIKNIIPDSDSRLLAFGGGFGIILASIIIYRLDQSKIKIQTEIHGTGDSKPKLPSKSTLSDTQRDILNFLESQYIQHGAVSQTATEEKFTNIGKSELYYRLEVLLYQGFIRKTSGGIEEGKPKHIYKLSKEYCTTYNIEYSGSPDETMFTPSNKR